MGHGLQRCLEGAKLRFDHGRGMPRHQEEVGREKQHKVEASVREVGDSCYASFQKAGRLFQLRYRHNELCAMNVYRELLGTAHSIGCTVDGEHPHDLIDKIREGELGLSVLDGQFDGDFQAFPFFGVFADIVTDLLWGETEWSDFWGQSSGWGYFSSDGSEFDDHDGGWIEFWWHLRRIKTLLSVSST